MHEENEGSKLINTVYQRFYIVVRELLLFIIVRLVIFITGGGKDWETLHDYIINITCDKTLTLCVDLENLGLEY